MANIASETSRPIPPIVETRLRGLRGKIVVWFLVDGASRVLLLLVGLALFDLLLDWLTWLDVPQRAIMLVLIVTALAAVAVWRVVLPLTKLPTDDALILRVEDRNKHLGQALISSVQFSRQGEDHSAGVSKAMVRATIARGVSAAEQVNFANTLDAARFGVNLGLLALALLVVAAGCVAIDRTETMSIWFNRNVLLGDASWPQKTYFEIVGANNGVIVLPRGEDWKQVVMIAPDSVEIPANVYIDFRPAYSRPAQKMIKTDQKDGREFEIVFKNVVEQFQFRARSGRARSDWVQVELVDQPAVRDLKLTVTSPAYAGGKTEELPAGRGPYYVLQGSSLSLSGKANKSLREAVLSVGDKTFPLEITGELQFATSIPAGELNAGKYTIDLTDTIGLVSKRPTSFGLRIRPDREPRLRASLVGISGLVVPQAMIPFSCRVQDDYLVTRVWLSYDRRGETDDQAVQTGEIEFNQLQDKLGQAEVSFDDIFDLKPLDIPTGTRLRFVLQANDNDTINGPKTGKSSEFLLRVVTEEEWRTDLLRREKEQREEFKRLKDLQDELVTDCRALAAGVADKPNFDAEQKQNLMNFQRRQKLLSTNVATIARRLEEFVVEVQNNRLESEGSAFETRLHDRIIHPMEELAELAIPEAVRNLDKTRRVADQPAERDAALGEAIDQQQQIADAMTEILNHMAKAEGYQEAVNLLYEIEKAEKHVHDLTDRENRERIKRIFEQGGDVKPQDTGTPDGSSAP